MKERARRIAVVDIGSNNIHLAVFLASRNGALKVLLEEKRELALGRAENGVRGMSRSKEKRLGRSVEWLVRRARSAKAETVLLLATEALREDARRREIVAALGRRAGTPVRLLTGEREAELGFLAARGELHPRGAQLFVDAGGGSTEITLSMGRRRLLSASIPIGNSGLSREVRGDPPGFTELAGLRARVEAALAAAPRGPAPRSALFSGGMCDHLCALGGCPPTGFNLRALDRAARKLLKQRRAKLAGKLGLRLSAAGDLAPAAVILGAVLERYGLHAARVTKRGVREGAALAYLKDGANWWRGRRI